MNRASALIGLGLLVLAGVLWLRLHDATVRAGALLAQRDSVLELRQQEMEASEALRLTTASEHAALRGKLDQANARTAAHDSLLRVTAGRLDSALHVRIPPDLAPLLDSLIETFHERLVGKDSTIARKDEALRLALGDQAACDSAAVKLGDLVQDFKAQAAAWRKRAEPGLLTRVVRGVPWLAAGAGTVAVLVLAKP